MCFACFAVPAPAATFTTNALITEADASFDGKDIVVNAATLTVDGRHSFNSLLLTNGAVHTRSPCAARETHKLDLVATNEVVTSANSRIDASGKGYLPGRTSLSTTVGGASGLSAGSYGGLATRGGGANAVYRDYADPDDWDGGGTLSAGGGLARLTSGSLQLDGQLLANGTSDCGGGGSRGGIFVAVSNLTGRREHPSSGRQQHLQRSRRRTHCDLRSGLLHLQPDEHQRGRRHRSRP